MPSKDEIYWAHLQAIAELPPQKKDHLAASHIGWTDLVFYRREDGHKKRRGLWGKMPGCSHHRSRCSCPEYSREIGRLKDEIVRRGWTARMEQRFHLNINNIFAIKPGGFRDSAQVLVNASPEDWCAAFIMTMEEIEEGIV